MKIDKGTIDYIAKLAKLSFSDDEALKFASEFESILEHFKNIDKEDIDKDKDILNADLFESVLRKDEVKSFENKNELFRNTKQTEDGHIEIPRILE